MLILAGIEFEVVGTVVEGNHRAGANRAFQVAVALGVLNRRAAVGFSRGHRGLEEIQFVRVEPSAIAVAAMVDFDAIVMLNA